MESLLNLGLSLSIMAKFIGYLPDFQFAIKASFFNFDYLENLRFSEEHIKFLMRNFGFFLH